MVDRVSQRIGEIDLLRATALILMIFFHLMYDLNHFLHLPVDYEKGIIYYLGKLSATLFIFIAGISSTLSDHNFQRGLKILFFACLVTLTTSLVMPDAHIFFGILHFLAVCILLSPFWQRLNTFLLLAVACLMPFINRYVSTLDMPNDLWLPLGLTSNHFYSADYYPLVPWLAVFLYGIILARIAYPDKKSLFQFYTQNIFLRFLNQNALLIYLVHQPILLFFLYLPSLVSL